VRLVGSSEQRTLCIRAESRSARKLRRVGVCTVPPGVGETTPDNTPRAAPGATPVHEYPDPPRIARSDDGRCRDAVESRIVAVEHASTRYRRLIVATSRASDLITHGHRMATGTAWGTETRRASPRAAPNNKHRIGAARQQ